MKTRNKHYPIFKVVLVQESSDWFKRIFRTPRTEIVIEISDKNRDRLRHLVTGDSEVFKLVPVKAK